MDSQATASLIASVLVGLSTAAFGAMLVVQGRVTSPSPLILCGVAGLLVGISLLVVLPQAAESLHEQGYKMETVFVLFLAAAFARRLPTGAGGSRGLSHVLGLPWGSSGWHLRFKGWTPSICVDYRGERLDLRMQAWSELRE